MNARGIACVLLLSCSTPAHGFCGFYVASGDAKLFNHASQVVLAREGDHTVLTMVSDYQGDPKQFALVVPVPTMLERGQIHVGDPAVVDKLDQWSAPRLVEYWDPDPCPRPMDNLSFRGGLSEAIEVRAGRRIDTKSSTSMQSVHIEARYTVDEYDIVLLTADQSDALLAWLKQNGYTVPAAAGPILASYLKQGMHFFVAKVNLPEQARLGYRKLRPLQIAYDSPRFMLPVRLGMVNANGPQELIVYALTKQGRVEPVNYRNVRLPTGEDVPALVKADWAHFYRDLFAHEVAHEGGAVVFTEHFWPLGWCDPCAGPMLSADELRGFGTWWLPTDRGLQPNDVFITRLHARYDRATFPEDLVLQVTPDTQPWQSRFVIHHEFAGDDSCPELGRYRATLPARREKEAHSLVALAGWDLAATRAQMGVNSDWRRPDEPKARWWESVWAR